MGRPDRSRITGGDGYAEVEANELAEKKGKNRYRSPREDMRVAKNKEVELLRKEESKWRRQDERASKTLHPKGTGKRK